MKKHHKKQPETKEIVLHGFIYTLVKSRDSVNGMPPPCFMGQENWALHSVTKIMKRVKKPTVKLKRTK